MLLLAQGKKEEAENYYRKAQELSPYDPDIHYGHAIVLSKLRRKTEAEDQYLKAIQLNPYNADYHISFANLLREKGRFYEAKKEANVALKITPDNAYALASLGDILADDGNLKEAELVYKEVLVKLVSSNPISSLEIESQVRNSLGWVYSQDEKYKEAEKEYKEATRLNPENKDATENLRSLSRVTSVPRTSPNQIIISICLLIFLIASYIFAWYKIISETVFTAAQSTIFVVLILAVLFIQHIGYFKVASVEFKMSEQSYAFARFKPAEMKRN